MSPASVHGLLVVALRDLLEGRATITDAGALGTEQVGLLCEDQGAAMLLHLFLAAPLPVFWIEPGSRRRPWPGSGFGDWLRLQVQGARIERVTTGDSGRVLRLVVAPIAGPRRTLVLDPLPNACRFLVLDEQGRVEQRFPAPIHAASAGRGAPGSTYEEPAAGFSERWRRWAPASAGLSDPPRLQVCAIVTAQAAAAELLLSPIEGAALTVPDARVQALSGPCEPLEAARRIGELWTVRLREIEGRRQAHRLLANELRHLTRLAQRVDEEAGASCPGADLRRQAETMLAHAGRVPRGASEIVLPDVGDPTRELRIALDPARGFADNVNRLFHQAGRLERALAQREAKRRDLQALTARTGEWLARVEGGDPGWLPAPGPSDASPRSTAAGRSAAPVPWLPDIEELRGAAAMPGDPGLRRRWEQLLARLREVSAGLTAPLDHTGFAARRAGAPGAVARAVAATRTRAAADGDRAGPPRGPTEAAAERAGIHPRRYAVTGGWIVLVGRTNTENDTLTHQAARPNDLWFHARGVAGSHVVLQRGDRKDNPSKAALEEAAAIAAFYSKARTSRHAPVICTDKRYVRKPRKSPPGLAVCIREKVLMVEPRLPAGSAAEENG